MKHHTLITKKPLLAQAGGEEGGAENRKEASINFKLDTTAQIIQAIYNKSLF